jgi:hypothetical protein
VGLGCRGIVAFFLGDRIERMNGIGVAIGGVVLEECHVIRDIERKRGRRGLREGV